MNPIQLRMYLCTHTRTYHFSLCLLLLHTPEEVDELLPRRLHLGQLLPHRAKLLCVARVQLLLPPVELPQLDLGLGVCSSRQGHTSTTEDKTLSAAQGTQCVCVGGGVVGGGQCHLRIYVCTTVEPLYKGHSE